VCGAFRRGGGGQSMRKHASRLSAVSIDGGCNSRSGCCGAGERRGSASAAVFSVDIRQERVKIYFIRAIRQPSVLENGIQVVAVSRKQRVEIIV
jgi:hypothetical protein